MKLTLCFFGPARFLLPQADPRLPQSDPISHRAVPYFIDWRPPLPCPAVASYWDPIHHSSKCWPTARTGPPPPRLPLLTGRAPSTDPHSIPFFTAILITLMSPVLAHPATPKSGNVCAPPSCCSTSKPHQWRTSERQQFQFFPFSMNNNARHNRYRFTAVGENLARSLLP
jgi:hypothetical protein